MLNILFLSSTVWVGGFPVHFLFAANSTNLVEISGFFQCSFCHLVQKRAKAVQTNLVAYLILDIDFKSEVKAVRRP